MSVLDDQQRLDLKNLINANDTEDVTDDIRNKKQSTLIRNDIKQIVFLKKKYERLAKSNPGEFEKMCISQCAFLYNNYTDIFHKIKNDILNLSIMENFLNILKRIEDGELNQHEGSYLVGKYLKELYIDSAMRHQNKIENNERKKKTKKKPPQLSEQKNISYKDFKKLQN